jgi:hypothetical protein
MDLGLNGRTVVVTGGTGALGRAVVARLLAEGARPVVTWRSERELRDFPAGDRVRLEKLDLADESAVNGFYRGLGGLWASVHLAGAFNMATVEKTTAADFLGMFATNALSCFLCSREAVRAMPRREAPPARAVGRGNVTGSRGGGRIVNVAARPALVPTGGMIAYSTSEGRGGVADAVPGGRGQARRHSRQRRRPLADGHARQPRGHDQRRLHDLAQGRAGRDAILFLASPANALTSGTVVPVYGRA